SGTRELLRDPCAHGASRRADVVSRRIEQIHFGCVPLAKTSIECELLVNSLACAAPRRPRSQSFREHVFVANEREIAHGRKVAPLDTSLDVRGTPRPAPNNTTDRPE